MKNILLTITLLVLPAFASASEITGTVNTSVNSGVSNGIEGTYAPTPTASPAPGTYTSAQSVTLSASGSDGIRYTVDSASPSCTTGTLYSGAITVSTSQTIRAVACYNGAVSQTGVFAYGINIPAAPSGGGGGGGGGGGLPAAGRTGDITGPVSAPDTHVDLLDFNALVVAWGTTGASVPADLNRDGVVDLLDFNLLIVNWTG